MIFLHIGLGKTGTSTIQRFLADHRENLADHGVIYPTIGQMKGGDNHHNLAHQVTGSNNVKAGLGNLEDIALLARQEPSKNIVLSTEYFSVFNHQNVTDTLSYFSGLNVIVVVYIRHLENLIPSIYNQWTKHGHNVRDFDAIFSSLLRGKQTKFADQLGPWFDNLNPRSIIVRQLDSSVLFGGNLISDFLNVLGVEENVGKSWNQKDQNASLGWKTVEVIRAVQQSLRKKGVIANPGANRAELRACVAIRKTFERVMVDLDLNSHRAQYLTPSQQEQSASRYSAEIGRLNDILSTSLIVPRSSPLPERPFMPAVEHIPAGELQCIAQQYATARNAEFVGGPATQKHVVEVLHELAEEAGRRGLS